MLYIFHFFAFIHLKNRNFNRKIESIVGVNEKCEQDWGRVEKAETLFNVNYHGRVDRPCESI